MPNARTPSVRRSGRHCSVPFTTARGGDVADREHLIAVGHLSTIPRILAGAQILG